MNKSISKRVSFVMDGSVMRDGTSESFGVLAIAFIHVDGGWV